jgi:hypothetical protein
MKKDDKYLVWLSCLFFFLSGATIVSASFTFLSCKNKNKELTINSADDTPEKNRS